MRPGSPLRLQPLPPSETTHAAPTTPLAPPNGRPPPAPGPEVAVGAISRRLSPNRQPSRFSALSWTAGTPRPGRAARPISAASAEGRTVCHPKGRSAAKDARSALTRRPARSYSAPTIPATVRYARRRSGERHERSIPRPPALPAPLADPPIAPQPTHTRLRRASSTPCSSSENRGNALESCVCLVIGVSGLVYLRGRKLGRGGGLAQRPPSR